MFQNFNEDDEREFLENNDKNYLIKDDKINELINQNKLLVEELDNIKNAKIINRLKKFIKRKFKV